MCLCKVIRLHTVHLQPRGHGRSLYMAAPTTFFRRDECDRPDKQCPSSSDPRSGQGDGSPTVFSKEGDASTAAASLLLLLAGDIETNPGPSCYACGQNFRQSDTPLSCHAQDCGARSHKQTRCSDDFRSPYRGIAQPTVDPGHQLPLRRLTPATAATTRSSQAPGLSPVLLRAA